MDVTPAVEMRQITKGFPGVLANDRIDFSANWGEMHALIGENGAGKTTLMNILYGLHRPDAGETLLSGRAVKALGPRHAIACGIGMVHQHFMLVPAFSALENVILGAEPVRFGQTDYRRAEERVRAICERFGLQVDLHAKVADLSVSAQQKVEILKALYREARILILDEPTSVLTPQECDSLFAMLREMARSGMCIILITHKLREVMANSDRVTVLRQGRAIAGLETNSTTAEELARLMVGERELVRPPEEREASPAGPPLLAVINLSVPGDRGLRAVDSISFQVHAGEILGVAGVDGNGQRELAEALVGLRRAAGNVEFEGRNILRMSVRRRLDAGIAYVPEDSGRYGLVSSYSVEENAILGAHRGSPFARWGILDRHAARRHALNLIERVGVRAAETRMPARFLSGGNRQKLVLGRALYRKPKLLVASQPTRGLDVGAAQDVHLGLLEACARGGGILLISYDLDEIFSLADRVMVMFQGRIAGMVGRAEADRETIGALMLGARS